MLMAEVTYCINHPQSETLLRCNKCNRPVCMKCVERTPVGYRCKECLGQQRQGYYNAISLDYVLAAGVGLILGVAGGIVGSLTGIFLSIFAGPIAGGIIAEGIRWAIRKHRGRYIWLAGCGAIFVGGLLGLTIWPLFLTLETRRAVASFATTIFTNIGFWIYLALAISTAYARLRV